MKYYRAYRKRSFLYSVGFRFITHEMDLVSAIITTYKRAPQIVERAVRSVVEQTYQNLEIIVVDDSPPEYPYRDDIRKITEKYRDKREIRYLRHEQNKGACAARNTGIKDAKGLFVCFLDDDDEYAASKVEKQVRLLSGSDYAGLIYCNCLIVDDDTGEQMYQKKKFHRGNVHYQVLIRNFIGTTSFPLIRKECLIDAGGFDEELPACQDYDMWIRLCERYPVDFIDEPLVIYHNHSGDQITKNAGKRIIALNRIIHKNKAVLEKDKKLWCIFRLKLMDEYLRENDLNMVTKILSECFHKYPWLLKRYFFAVIQIAKTRMIGVRK